MPLFDQTIPDDKRRKRFKTILYLAVAIGSGYFLYSAGFTGLAFAEVFLGGVILGIGKDEFLPENAMALSAEEVGKDT